MVKKCPTGIELLDSAIKGGFPYRSSILLRGDVGAGHREFAYTCAIRLHTEKPGTPISPPDGQEIQYPEKVYYLSISRTRLDILLEVETAFEPEFYDVFKKNVIIKDFTTEYYAGTSIPLGWVSDDIQNSKSNARMDEQITSHGSPGGLHRLLDSIQRYMESIDKQDTLIFIDSITDIAMMKGMDFHDIVMFTKAIQIATNRWGNIIFLIYTDDILDTSSENIILDSVDGILHFEWARAGAKPRNREVFIQNFRGLVPNIQQDLVGVKFRGATTTQGYQLFDLQYLP